MQRICVYCGSSPGHDPSFAAAARALAQALAERGLGLVYGGASVGVMGVVADAALAAGCEVIGVLPRALQSKELAHAGLSTLHLVESMHERKALMVELADGFIALPGGFGTLDELFETLTWAQLGIHRKPIGLLNSGGYYDKLIEFLRAAVAAGFVRAEQLTALLVDDHALTLLQRFSDYRPMLEKNWLDIKQS